MPNRHHHTRSPAAYAGRQTVYAGVTMRSRTEAGFAAYLDAQDLPWQYEPRAFACASGQYLPDFLVDLGRRRLYVEVKASSWRQCPGEMADRMAIVWASEPAASLLLAVHGAAPHLARRSGHLHPATGLPGSDWVPLGLPVWDAPFWTGPT